MSRQPQTRLHIVTGKGGTGKTTAAAALALSLATAGRRVLLCEVENRQGIAQVFDVAPLPYEERKIASTRAGGQVFGLAIDAESALLEYLAIFYKLGRAGRALDKFGVIDFATTIAPGVRDVLLTGKVYEAHRRRRDDGGFVYDAIVVDAPPTGRIAQFLNVNSEVAGLAKVGPIRKQAESIMTMMRAPRTRVHLVTLLEEMPVQETIDGIAELESERIPVGRIIVNQARQSLFNPEDTDELADVDTADLQKALAGVSVNVDDADIAHLLSSARVQVEREELQRTERAELEALDRPIVTLPYVPSGIDLGALYELAEAFGSGAKR